MANAAQINLDPVAYAKRLFAGVKAFVVIVLCFIVGFGAYAVAQWLAPEIGIQIGSSYAETLVFAACAYASVSSIGKAANSILP